VSLGVLQPRGVRDDREGLLATMGMKPRRSQLAHLLSTTPTLFFDFRAHLVDGDVERLQHPRRQTLFFAKKPEQNVLCTV
jgi:hypothetical protein